MADSPPPQHPRTPDGRYFVVRGRLWRLSDPRLGAEAREGWVKALMAARRDVLRQAQDEGPRQAERVAEARGRVDAAKRALGERGPVWWDDGAPDLNRRRVAGTVYAAWYRGLGGGGAA